ncbi:hypothetical protein [Wolbachia endosymbiont of Ctenocephalides felis wCfeT]|uniref:hypothetical protein n=1 Tax=Wolbachia endosymbiont of Ctenocephalides felis wCfeT TaxID=2732593 RepID=UPI001445B049|nr:hypothetical protein [Wolbachia endosymbiont of Ctenocephalides felis wCfeT]
MPKTHKVPITENEQLQPLFKRLDKMPIFSKTKEQECKNELQISSEDNTLIGYGEHLIDKVKNGKLNGYNTKLALVLTRENISPQERAYLFKSIHSGVWLKKQ